MCLKLVKSGQIVASRELKLHFLNAAKELSLISDSQIIDPKKLEALKNNLDKMLASTKTPTKAVENGDYIAYFKRIEKRFGKMKSKYEQKLIDMFTEFTTHKAEDYSEKACNTSIMQKALKSLMKEIMEQVVPTNCPHC